MLHHGNACHPVYNRLSVQVCTLNHRCNVELTASLLSRPGHHFTGSPDLLCNLVQLVAGSSEAMTPQTSFWDSLTWWCRPELIHTMQLLCRFTRLMTGSPTKAQETKLQGLYMYGGVGVGKTMLMDLLAHSAPSSFQVGYSLSLVTCICTYEPLSSINCSKCSPVTPH